jgi:hypothetical protein
VCSCLPARWCSPAAGASGSARTHQPGVLATCSCSPAGRRCLPAAGCLRSQGCWKGCSPSRLPCSPGALHAGAALAASAGAPPIEAVVSRSARPAHTESRRPPLMAAQAPLRPSPLPRLAQHTVPLLGHRRTPCAAAALASSSATTSLHSSKQQDNVALKAHIASVYFKCFRLFGGELQVFYINVEK